MAGNCIEPPSPTSTGTIGLMICYDIRFPEISRILAVQGAEILAVPSAWIQGVMKEEHWVTLLKARLIENGLYMVAPDQDRQYLLRKEHGYRPIWLGNIGYG